MNAAIVEGHGSDPTSGQGMPALLRQNKDDGLEGSQDEKAADESITEVERSLRCRNCGSIVTSAHHRISVDGRHDHVFFNPHGHVFELGCFSQAAGAAPLGPSTAEFSWFSNCTWQIAVCLRCRSHLGWKFTGPNRSFFALILDQLSDG